MRRTPLERKTPLKQASSLKTKSPMKKRRSKSARAREFSADIKTIITERSGGYCEYCHQRPIASIHHCKFRSQLMKAEGSGGLKNALGLCDMCDALVHGGKEGQKYRLIFEQLAEQLASEQPAHA